MSAQSDPRRAEASAVDQRYYYRRSLSVRELLPAIGAAVGAAVVTFYVVRLFTERTPLQVEPGTEYVPRFTLHRARGSSVTARNLGRR
jgi:hypothetical protein